MSRERLSGWGRTTLGEVAEINPTSLPSSTSGDFEFRYIDVATVAGPSILLEPRRLRFADAPSRARRVVADGDILVSTVRPYLRSFCRVHDSKADLVASTGFAVVRAREGVDSGFLYQHVLAEWFVEHLIPRMKGSNYPAVSPQDVAEYPLDLPPLAEQRHIAEILSSVDEAIQATQAVIEQTVKVNQSVLDGLLTQSIMHTDSVETPLGPLPPSWNVCALEDVCERVTYGFTNPMPTTDSGPWMVTAANVKGGKIDYSSARKTSTDAYREFLTDKSRPAIGTVLITKDGTLGRVALVDRDDICINQSVASLVPDTNKIESDFLSYSLQSSAMQARILAESGGTSVKHIYISKLSKTLLALPPLKEQRRIAEIAKAGERNLERQMGALAQLKSTKNSVASDLLTGRRRVSTDLTLAAE